MAVIVTYSPAHLKFNLTRTEALFSIYRASFCVVDKIAQCVFFIYPPPQKKTKESKILNILMTNDVTNDVYNTDITQRYNGINN